MNQLFVIGRDIWQTLSFREVNATCDGLKELGLYVLPYPKIDVEFTMDGFIEWYAREARPGAPTHPGAEFRVSKIVNLSINGPLPTMEICDLQTGRTEVYTDVDRLEDCRRTFCDLLISLLAVRNIQKTTKIDKLAKLGIGRNKHRYVYTTTLFLPPPHLIEGEESTSTGIKRCPHLRRGHIRHQRHGTSNQLTRKIWIEPVFIHADAEFVNQRAAYRVKHQKKDAA